MEGAKSCPFACECSIYGTDPIECVLVGTDPIDSPGRGGNGGRMGRRQVVPICERMLDFRD
jgi:hypothetical protein